MSVVVAAAATVAVAGISRAATPRKTGMLMPIVLVVVVAVAVAASAALVGAALVRGANQGTCPHLSTTIGPQRHHKPSASTLVRT